jgi:hypothetical protein
LDLGACPYFLRLYPSCSYLTVLLFICSCPGAAAAACRSAGAPNHFTSSLADTRIGVSRGRRAVEACLRRPLGSVLFPACRGGRVVLYTSENRVQQINGTSRAFQFQLDGHETTTAERTSPPSLTPSIHSSQSQPSIRSPAIESKSIMPPTSFLDAVQPPLLQVSREITWQNTNQDTNQGKLLTLCTDVLQGASAKDDYLSN